MPILFKCECGNVLMAQEAGVSYTCSCGGGGIVPDESDEECVLIYKDGFPSEGMAMTADGLYRMVSARQVGPLDLIFYEGSWQPLNMVYEIEAAPEPKVDEAEEIALHWSELNPVPGFSKNMEGIGYRGPGLGERLGRIFRLSNKTGKQKIAFFMCLIILLLAFYVTVGGSLVNRLLWRPVYVVVYNGEKQECTASFMGRKQVIRPGEYGQFSDIFVSLPFKRAVTLHHGIRERSVAVPMVPGSDWLVNPSGRAFRVYDTEKAVKQTVAEKSIQSLSEQVSRNVAPQDLEKVLKELLEAGEKSASGVMVNGELISGGEYDLSSLGLKRSEAYKAKVKPDGREKKKPALQSNERVTLHFANAELTFRNGKSCIDASWDMVFATAFEPVRGVSHKVENKTDKVTVGKLSGNVRCRVTNGKVLEMTLSKGDCETSCKDMVMQPGAGKVSRQFNYEGDWRYSVKGNGPAGKVSRWEWEWDYLGYEKKVNKKGARNVLKITYTKTSDGNEKKPLAVRERQK